MASSQVGRAWNFVRPAHGLVALRQRSDCADFCLGLKSGRETQATVSRPRCRRWCCVMRMAMPRSCWKRAVIASFNQRRQEFRSNWLLPPSRAGHDLKPLMTTPCWMKSRHWSSAPMC